MLIRANAFHAPPARWMAEAIVRSGQPVDFYATDLPSGESGSDSGVDYHILPLETRARASPLKKIANEIAWGLRFLRAVSGKSYSLYWAQNSTALPWCWLAARRARAPLIYEALEYYTWQDSSPIGKLYWLLERWIARRSEMVICPEPHRARFMQRDFKLSAAPLIVRNAMPLTAPVESRYLREYVRERGGGAGKIVLFQGGIAFHPPFEALLRSVPLWPSEDNLVLLGWSDEKNLKAIKEVIQELGLQGRIHLHPAVPHRAIWPIVCSADVGLVLYDGRIPNEQYAAPTKLGEYLMAGLAVVYIPCVGVQSLLEGRAFAVGAEEVSSQAIAAAVLQFQDPGALSAARAAARAYAEAVYHFEYYAGAVLDRVPGLLNGSSGHGLGERDPGERNIGSCAG